MAHSIQVIIGRNKKLEDFSSKWENAELLSLPQNIFLIPWTYDLRIEINHVPKPPKTFNDYFDFASQALIEILRKESSSGQIGYIETDYFGGIGKQASILYMNGEAIGPYKTEKFESKEVRAVNKILSILGVDKQNYLDEFAAVGFADVRSNNDLIKKYGS